MANPIWIREIKVNESRQNLMTLGTPLHMTAAVITGLTSFSYPASQSASPACGLMFSCGHCQAALPAEMCIACSCLACR